MIHITGSMKKDGSVLLERSEQVKKKKESQLL